MNNTYQPKAKDIKREWHLIDAKDQILGRIATQAAIFLMGKNKKTYSPHLDSGDYVVVLNAKDVKVTGNKEKQKTYYSHSGFPGGLKSTTLAELREKSPAKIIEYAVYNMLPKNRLRKERMTRLKIHVDSNHKYEERFKA